MRWDIIKKAWEVALHKFPKVKNLYVDLPESFSSKGSCKIYDLEKIDDIIGNLSYESISEHGQPSISIKIDDIEINLAQRKLNRKISITSSISKQPKVSAIDSKLMAHQYTDKLELGRNAALLIGNKKTITSSYLKKWMSENDFSSDMESPITEGLNSIGTIVTYDTGRGFNLKKAKTKAKYQMHQRVRINHPTSSEYQECGRIVGIQGNKKSGAWYMVLVDGSSSPIVFPESAIELNEAGIVIDPNLEPIEDA